MNISEYISSGIVESCVLGIADEDERGEFERLCAKYPRIADARNAFELLIERQALEGAMPPPRYVLAQLLPKIKAESRKLRSLRVAHPANGFSHTPKRGVNVLKYLAAASVAAILCCGYFLYRLQVNNKHLAQTNTLLLAKYKATDSTLAMLANGQLAAANKQMPVVHLTGTANTQPLADIYWDSASAAVYLVVKNLPPLPPTEQYQLWANIDGQPKSLGVFDATGEKVILKMNNAKKADAFAITVEPKGGNMAPTDKPQAEGKAAAAQ